MLVITDDGFVKVLRMDVSEIVEEALDDDCEEREENNFEIDLKVKVKHGHVEVSSEIVEGGWE